MSHRKIEEHVSHGPIVPHWMVTFSDMRVVLLCFFVLLVGFSSSDKENCGRAPGSLSGYPGLSETSHTDLDSLRPRTGASGGSTQMVGYESMPEYEQLNHVYQGLDVSVRDGVTQNALRCGLTDKGLEIQVQCGTLFEPHSDQIRDGSEKMLATIADACRGLPHQVRVQAYADDLFMSTEAFPTEESLALRRAAVICALLHAKARLPLEQLSMGTDLPTADTAFAPRNSQVVVVILPISRKRSL